MQFATAYVALGGNFPETLDLFMSAVMKLRKVADQGNIQVSKCYRTAPISSIPQSDYLNAVCRFDCQLDPLALLLQLQTIEFSLGKRPKLRDEPRAIDLDLIIYGEHQWSSLELLLPHPRWQERLFVVRPLLDLTKTVGLPHSDELIYLEPLAAQLAQDPAQKVAEFPYATQLLQQVGVFHA